MANHTSITFLPHCLNFIIIIVDVKLKVLQSIKLFLLWHSLHLNLGWKLTCSILLIA